MDPAVIPLEHGLLLSAMLFCLGLIGVMIRRNFLFILMSLEIMANAAGMAFILAGAKWGQPDGQVMFMLILSVAAAEVAVALGLLLQFHHRFKTLDVDSADRLRG
jgi:NADH-quinone oxidoreductase subunit K